MSTEARQAAGARRDGLLAACLDSLPDPVVVVDDAGAILFVNDAFMATLGYERAQLAGRPVTMLSGGAGAGAADEAWAAIPPAAPLRAEVLVRRADGRTYPAALVAAPVAGDAERAPACVITLRDLTEPRREETRLAVLASSFRAVIDFAPDAIAIHAAGRIVYANRACAALLGFERSDDLVGHPVMDLVYPDDRPAVAARVKTMLQTWTPASPNEERFVCRDGTVLTAEATALPIMFGTSPALAVIARDLTARKDLAAKMMTMDRMIAIGTLAAGVGHEINNPLTYVVSNLAFVASELGQVQRRPAGSKDAPDAPAPATFDTLQLAEMRAALGEALEGTDRVRRIVRDLKVFSRMEHDRKEIVTLEPIVESAINMAWNEIRHRATLVRAFGRTPPVSGNGARLGQVVLNLLVNAAQAIPEGRAADNEIRVATSTDASGRAVLEVSDTGSGIAPDLLGKIFVPFFTTKPVGQGTGLGLGICQGIVHGIGGEITVESVAGKGSTFRVVLPAAISSRPAPRSSIPIAQGPRARVLVVDDEGAVGRSLQRLLGREHDVVVVNSGAEALGVLREGKAFDVILCDLMMPVMTGMELYAELARAFPEQTARVVFITGGAFTPAARAFLDGIPNMCLDKPVDPNALRRLVMDTLVEHEPH